MGQHADDLRDWEYRNFQRPHIDFIDGPSKPSKPRWKTAKGDILYIEDMTTQHIKNSIAKLAREDRTFQPLQAELDKRNNK